MPVPVITIDRRIGSSLDYEVDLSFQQFLDSQDLASATATFAGDDGGLIIDTPDNLVIDGKSFFLHLSGGSEGKVRIDAFAVAADGQIFDQPIDVVTSAGAD